MKEWKRNNYENPIDVIVKSSTKRRIYNTKGFYYSLPDNIYKAYGKMSIDMTLIGLARASLNTYLQNMDLNTYYVNNEDIFPMSINNGISQLTLEKDMENVRMIRRFKRNFPDKPISFRLESNKYMISIFIDRDEESKNNFIGSIIFTDDIRKFSAIATLNVNSAAYDDYNNGVVGFFRCAQVSRFLFITSKKERISNQIAVTNANSVIIEESFVYALNTGLHLIFTYELSDKEHGINHNSNEMILFKKAISLLQIKELICPIYKCIGDEQMGGGVLSRLELPEYMGNPESHRLFPLIQLSDREINFVNKYTKEHALDSNNRIDLQKYLGNPRYGNTVKFDINMITEYTAHDRPERTKIVKAIDKKYYEMKEKKLPVEEKDYVIWRILKTKTEARTTVEKMHGTRADAEYVMEEWERVGHYRTLKSGKQVWINATTCKRHLPLTEKEIRIKL